MAAYGIPSDDISRVVGVDSGRPASSSRSRKARVTLSSAASEAAVVRVEDYLLATNLIAQTTMRSVLGQSELDELLSKREEINARLQEIIDEQTAPWGIKVSIVEVKDVEIPERLRPTWLREEQPGFRVRPARAA